MGRRGASIESRFIKKGINDCWLWIGARTEAGYGKLRRNNKDWRAHIYIYIQTYGEYDNTNLVIDHKCNNPPCVNPNHLQAISQWANQQRRWGRLP